MRRLRVARTHTMRTGQDLASSAPIHQEYKFTGSSTGEQGVIPAIPADLHAREDGRKTTIAALADSPTQLPDLHSKPRPHGTPPWQLASFACFDMAQRMATSAAIGAELHDGSHRDLDLRPLPSLRRLLATVIPQHHLGTDVLHAHSSHTGIMTTVEQKTHQPLQ